MGQQWTAGYEVHSMNDTGHRINILLPTYIQGLNDGQKHLYTNGIGIEKGGMEREGERSACMHECARVCVNFAHARLGF